jgi:lipoprotein-anchoring transpeptidase ErfK/SrfK
LGTVAQNRSRLDADRVWGILLRFGLAGRFVHGIDGVNWRALLGAGIATAALAVAAPAEANWFYEPQTIAAPLPDARALAAKRLSAKRKNAAEARAALKSKEPEKLPAGPLHIIISIKDQRLTLYANGKAVAHSPVSTGVPGHPTPLGVFSIIQKEIYHESNLYSSAPMPYMQRITWSGVAMHQGVLPGRPASHGCIRLPREFAQRLWRITKVGARVIVAQDDAPLSEISNARLFAPKSQQPVVSDAIDATPIAKIRIATAGGLSDAALKGTIDANENARIESAIDKAVAAGLADAFVAAEMKRWDTPEKPALVESPKDAMLKPGPISVYVSRKQGMLYVRKGFSPVFEAPVAIAQADQPLGTHVFTALEQKDDRGALRWSVVSLPTDRVVKKGTYIETRTARGERLRKELTPPTHEVTPPGDPNAALDRITIPEPTLARIAELMTPGASLIISDLGISYETGAGTDFIVLTR